MGYYNGYPASYQPPMFLQQPNPQQNGLTWVQGEAAAKSYLIAPGATVALWDCEEKTIYLKSADASGMPSMKVLDYTIRGEAEQPAVEYATKDELKALSDKIKGLRDEITGKRRKMLTEDDDDE